MEYSINEPILRMDEWLECPNTEPEIAATFGKLYFACGNIDFTSHRIGSSYCNASYLPAYPLALWIAESWWRLFYEPRSARSTYEWSTTHCMRSAGHGFLWPDVWMQTDGIFMDIMARSYVADAGEPIEYFQRESRGIPRDRMEACFSRFVGSVIERLDGKEPSLEKLWREVLRERESCVLSFQRTIEAILGYDPDALSEQELQALTKSGEEMGNSHLLEALAAFHYSDVARGTNVHDDLHALIHCHGIRGRFNLPDLPHETFSLITQEPQEFGRYVARHLRKEADCTGKIDNNMLRDMLGVSEKDFNSSQAETKAPFSFAMEDADAYLFTFSKESTESRRFQLARFIGDFCASQIRKQDTKWLILSDSATFRQKVQRAFAAELLMPVRLITEYTGGHYTLANVKKVAAEFGVSPVLAATQLAKHELITPADVELYAAS